MTLFEICIVLASNSILLQLAWYSCMPLFDGLGAESMENVWNLSHSKCSETALCKLSGRVKFEWNTCKVALHVEVFKKGYQESIMSWSIKRSKWKQSKTKANIISLRSSEQNKEKVQSIKKHSWKKMCTVYKKKALLENLHLITSNYIF